MLQPTINRCHSPDVECTAPTSKENYICCPTTDICVLMENTDKEGVFLAFCVRDPRACSPGMFSCASMINSCCPDGYLCGVRTWENLTYPVCLASPSLGKRIISSSESEPRFTLPRFTPPRLTPPRFTLPLPTDTTTSSPHQTSQPTDIVPGGNGEPPTYLHWPALAGLVVGAICGTAVVTLAVAFAIRKCYRRRRTKREETLRENASSGIPQPNHMKDSGPYESGGAEILEAGGSGLAELPNQGAPLCWYELPAGMEDSIDPQFSRIRDEDSQQPAAE